MVQLTALVFTKKNSFAKKSECGQMNVCRKISHKYFLLFSTDTSIPFTDILAPFERFWRQSFQAQNGSVKQNTKPILPQNKIMMMWTKIITNFKPDQSPLHIQYDEQNTN